MNIERILGKEVNKSKNPNPQRKQKNQQRERGHWFLDFGTHLPISQK